MHNFDLNSRPKVKPINVVLACSIRNRVAAPPLRRRNSDLQGCLCCENQLVVFKEASVLPISGRNLFCTTTTLLCVQTDRK